MNWNDYEGIWKRQELPVGAGADLSALRETFETKRRRMAATLFLRDVLESSAGVVVLFAFALLWWKQGRAGWPIGLAMVCILWLTAFFVRERIRAHRTRLEADAPLLAKLGAEIAELRHQQHLLLGVAKWYLAPCVAAILIVLGTILANAPAGALADHRLFVAGFFGAYLVLVGFLYWLVWFANRRTVRKQIEPRLAELETLRQSLLS